jgi:aminotransferase
MADDYAKRRDTMLEVLEGAGFRCFRPHGAYYIMTDISGFGYADDMEFARHLIEDVGVAAVPGSSFFEDPRDGAQMIRFCFCKKYETLEAAKVRLRNI